MYDSGFVSVIVYGFLSVQVIDFCHVHVTMCMLYFHKAIENMFLFNVIVLIFLFTSICMLTYLRLETRNRVASRCYPCHMISYK